MVTMLATLLNRPEATDPENEQAPRSRMQNIKSRAALVRVLPTIKGREDSTNPSSADVTDDKHSCDPGAQPNQRSTSRIDLRGPREPVATRSFMQRRRMACRLNSPYTA